MNIDLRKQLTQTRKQHSEELVALQSQHSTATRSIQEQCSNLKQELEASNSKIRQLEHRQEGLTRLQSGIMELWSVVTTAPEFEQLGQELEIDDPESMMCFLKVQDPSYGALFHYTVGCISPSVSCSCKEASNGVPKSCK